MNITEALRKGEFAVYIIVIFLTVLLLGISLYLTFVRLYELLTATTTLGESASAAVYNILSDIFLVIVFIELIDTFVTYLEQRRIAVYRIIDVALVALARELFIYLAPVNKGFELGKAAAIVAGTLVVGAVAYLQRRALVTRRKIIKRKRGGHRLGAVR